MLIKSFQECGQDLSTDLLLRIWKVIVSRNSIVHVLGNNKKLITTLNNENFLWGNNKIY